MMKFAPNILKFYLVGGSQDVGNDPDRFLYDVETALAAGGTAFQYREKGGSRLDHAANLPATLQTGVAGVAVISMILASPDITATVKAMRAAYQSK